MGRVVRADGAANGALVKAVQVRVWGVGWGRGLEGAGARGGVVGQGVEVGSRQTDARPDTYQVVATAVPQLQSLCSDAWDSLRGFTRVGTSTQPWCGLLAYKPLVQPAKRQPACQPRCLLT